jgi:hypothetical protein
MRCGCRRRPAGELNSGADRVSASAMPLRMGDQEVASALPKEIT